MFHRETRQIPLAPWDVASRHEDANKVDRHDSTALPNLADIPPVPASWLKDLATLRNPQSPITFLNYLHSEGRLVSFINNGAPIPSRKEFSDYLAWAASYVQSNGVSVFFGEKVVAIPKGPDGTVDVVSRSLKSGEHITRRTSQYPTTPSPITES